MVFIALFYCGRPLLATLTLKVTEPIFRPLSSAFPVSACHVPFCDAHDEIVS
jgi:hypothetical protein